ncbi:MAG: metallophosphoesterase [Armatimonadetes bacterium]|nr:metallophosphoesterase [Armatimonadota bacterium]MDW8029245.1 metallophosphoesterase [Armatimonadota bacterium]
MDWFLSLSLMTLLGFLGYGFWESFQIKLVHYHVRSLRFKNGEGFRIAHISDLHMTKIGLKEKKALDLVKEFCPDMIALTGDLIPLGKGLEAAEEFLRALSEIAPLFAVEGNSEVVNGLSRHFAKMVESLGGHWLHNEALEFRKGIWVAGTADPHWRRDDIVKTLSAIPSDAFCLLLSHSPDIVRYRESSRADLILCGHTHGGQIRLPFLGPLYIRARYIRKDLAWGMHELGNGAKVITTSGIGTTRLPIRFLCPPEVVGVTVTSLTNRSG